MATKRKEIQEYKVDEETRTVKVYAKTLSEQAERKIKIYRENDYKIVLLDRSKPSPREKTRIGKKEMIRYLKDEIDSKIYGELVKKINDKEKFCNIRQWLKEALQDYAKENNKKYIPANTIIQVAIANEKYIAQENSREYENKNKFGKPKDQNENEEDTEEK